ncbi:MAG: tRNA-(ms[2]io[6]A)-hydroxylase [Bacteroidetes bacterium]|nr:tRNA-(ms[2]io[6]A)-hydroxylase [Bacteroidota bacterium]
MFRLQLPTDPRWVNLAAQDLEEILTDHAWCEQKAASSAISLMVQFSEFPELVEQMSALVKEEMEHFQRVFYLLKDRGFSLGRERKDAYVGSLLDFQRKGQSVLYRLRDKLLMAALIEARSCERFRLLSEQLPDPDLKAFYRELMESEAAHYTLFITLARDLTGRGATDERWKEWLDYEAGILLQFSQGKGIHG